MPLAVTDPLGLDWEELLREAAAGLAEAGVDGAARDVRRLLTHLLQIGPERLSLILADQPDEEQISAFRALVARRRAREPLAQIIGQREFYGRLFEVTPAVLDPRPETEHLVETALDGHFRSVLDLGTGSGCIILSLLAERPMAHGVAADISDAALAVARRNAERLGLDARLRLVVSDWYGALSGRFDLIVSNPPYIGADDMDALQPEVRQHEPAIALTPGKEPLAAYRQILAGTARFLAPGGRLVVECGAGQGAAVAALFEAAGLGQVHVGQDLAGRDRVVRGRKDA